MKYLQPRTSTTYDIANHTIDALAEHQNGIICAQIANKRSHNNYGKKQELN